MNPDELRDAADRAAELLDAATPGSWSQAGAEVERNLEGWSRVIATCDEVADAALIAATPDLLAVLGPAARQLADTRDENERLRGEVEAWHEVADRTLALLDEKDRLRRSALDECKRLRTVLAGLGDPATIRVMADNLTGIGWTPEAEVMHAAADAAAAARGEGT